MVDNPVVEGSGGWRREGSLTQRPLPSALPSHGAEARPKPCGVGA
jgi:hypothetical protein